MPLTMQLGSGRPSRPAPPPLPFETRTTGLRWRQHGTTGWTVANGIARRVPDTNRIVHIVELTGLAPDTTYEWQMPDVPYLDTIVTYLDDATTTLGITWNTFQPHPAAADYTTFGWSTAIERSYTLPTAHPDEFRIAAISDTHGAEHTNAIFIGYLAGRDADLIVHSGDMANGNGGANNANSWYRWCAALDLAVKPDGRRIPHIANPGNHEIWNGHGGLDWNDPAEYGPIGVKPDWDTQSRGDAEWYYGFFPITPGLTGYRHIAAGDWLGVWTLDPGITTSMVDGPQTPWVAATMAASPAIHKFPTMHYSPWPAGRRRMFGYTLGVRELWMPIFEQAQVAAVLTGHDHVWMKSPKIRGGSSNPYDEDIGLDPTGVRVIGAGSAGGGPREGRNPATKWWLEDSRATELQYYTYERGAYDPSSPFNEDRPPHPDDGATRPGDEVSNYWLIRLTPTSRTFESYDGTNTLFDAFTDEA